MLISFAPVSGGKNATQKKLFESFYVNVRLLLCVFRLFDSYRPLSLTQARRRREKRESCVMILCKLGVDLWVRCIGSSLRREFAIHRVSFKSDILALSCTGWAFEWHKLTFFFCRLLQKTIVAVRCVYNIWEPHHTPSERHTGAPFSSKNNREKFIANASEWLYRELQLNSVVKKKLGRVSKWCSVPLRWNLYERRRKCCVLKESDSVSCSDQRRSRLKGKYFSIQFPASICLGFAEREVFVDNRIKLLVGSLPRR